MKIHRLVGFCAKMYENENSNTHTLKYYYCSHTQSPVSATLAHSTEAIDLRLWPLMTWDGEACQADRRQLHKDHMAICSPQKPGQPDPVTSSPKMLISHGLSSWKHRRGAQPPRLLTQSILAHDQFWTRTELLPFTRIAPQNASLTTNSVHCSDNLQVNRQWPSAECCCIVTLLSRRWTNCTGEIAVQRMHVVVECGFAQGTYFAGCCNFLQGRQASPIMMLPLMLFGFLLALFIMQTALPMLGLIPIASKQASKQ